MPSVSGIRHRFRSDLNTDLVGVYKFTDYSGGKLCLKAEVSAVVDMEHITHRDGLALDPLSLFSLTT